MPFQHCAPCFLSDVHLDLGASTSCLPPALAVWDATRGLAATGMGPAGAAARGHHMRSAVWTQLKRGSRCQSQRQSTKLNWKMLMGRSLRLLASFLVQLIIPLPHKPAIPALLQETAGPLSAVCSPAACIGCASVPYLLHASHQTRAPRTNQRRSASKVWTQETTKRRTM